MSMLRDGQKTTHHGQLLKQFVFDQKVSVTDLARDMGIPRTDIYRLYKQEILPKADLRSTITEAKILKHSPLNRKQSFFIQVISCFKGPFVNHNFSRYPGKTIIRCGMKIEKGGLGIKKDMYGLKHTGGDDKVHADMPGDWISMIFGHNSRAMTDLYTRNKQKILLKKISDAGNNFLPEQEGTG